MEFQSERNKLPLIFVGYVAIYILAYLVVYLFNQIMAMGCASFVGIDSSLRYFEVFYHIPQNSPQWSIGKISLIVLAGPLISLFIGSFLIYLIAKKILLEDYYKIFLFWLGFHFLLVFFGGIISGSFTGRGLGYIMDMMFWPQIKIYIFLCFLAIVILTIIGFLSSERFLKLAPSLFWMRRMYRRQYLFLSLFLPWLIGSFVIIVVKIPDQTLQHEDIFLHDGILLCSMIFLIAPMFLFKEPVLGKPSRSSREKIRKVYRKYIIVTMIFVILFRIVLSKGFPWI